MSRIPVSASVALAVLPVGAAALGLGEVETRSYLNQPLLAEIPVFSDTPAEIAGLDVTLASPDTFAAYGLQRPAFLSDLSFAVAPSPQGARIRMTSAQPVAEPFITVLLEVTWPQGRLLREYTVLLDPPSFAAGAVRRPVAAEPLVQAPPASSSVAPADQSGVPPPAVAVTAPVTGGNTHTVVRNETLWGIAERYRPDPGVSINQMMLAIYRANPEAFAGNVNLLNAGAVLRIPPPGSVEAIGTGEANAEIRRHNQEWRGGAAIERARLELVPPAEERAAGAGGAPAASSQPDPVRAELEETRRLLAVKDAELQALRNRLAQLEGAGDVAIEPELPLAAPDEEPDAAPEAAPEAAPQASAETAAPPAEAQRPEPVRRTEAASGGILGAADSLFRSVWLWIGAAAAFVFLTALMLARRRAVEAEAPVWQPTTRRREPEPDDVGEDVAEAPPGRADDDMIVEEHGRQATGGFERRAVPREDQETPLERTISAESPATLDQSDPLAEADFHMAYGLYDQAADLLTAAMAREPMRRDLQLKLLDVHFVWENRDGFLKEARKLHERIGNDEDPDWKRVVIMGKQLCPDEPLFAGSAVPAAQEMDLAFGSDGGTVDQPGPESAGLDFDLSGAEAEEFDPAAATDRPASPAHTQELPTMESTLLSAASTMETPTIESAALSATLETPTLEAPIVGGTMETPTLQAPLAGQTLETPTMEAWMPDAGGTAGLEGVAGDERTEQTAEIDLEDLGLDLGGLDDAARGLSTGLHEALPGQETGLDFDLTGKLADAAESEESTAELESGATLGSLARALASPDADDTAEQPGVEGRTGQTGRNLAPETTSDDLESLDIDLGLGGSEDQGSDLTATGLRALSPRRPEDPTMTEVGTKLDLARAYVDMGDPEGARSILNEVLEEGDDAQRHEAQQLLAGLNG